MEETFNGAMLRIARKAKGYSQGELSSALGVPQGTFSKYEQGLLTPQSETVERFAGALGVKPGFFYQRGGVLQPATPYHRSRARLAVKTKERTEAIANIFRLHAGKLLDALELTYNIVQVPASNQTPDKVAEITRRNLKLPTGPIDNLVATLEDNGLFVITFDFQTDQLDGFTIHGNDVLPIVFLNEARDPARKRFTLAHELGHIVMHSQLDGSSDIEREADEFASALLLPLEESKTDLRGLTLEKLAALKPKWKVSMAALLYRAKEVGTITPSEYKSLWIQMSTRGYRRIEPVTIPAEQPGLWRELVDTYLSEFQYSRAELAELLLVDESELSHYVDTGRFRLRLVDRAAP